MGRLFDAVAALVGVRQTVDYEAQAAIELEGLARGAEPGCGSYRFGADGPAVDPAPVLSAVIADMRAGVPAGVVAARFHRAVTVLVVHLAGVYGGPERTVALSGGVFCNALLLRTTVAALRTAGFTVLTHRRVPPNDGGIALGQLMIGTSG
jgi:hydrogenase maturation protein HypF